MWQYSEEQENVVIAQCKMVYRHNLEKVRNSAVVLHLGKGEKKSNAVIKESFIVKMFAHNFLVFLNVYFCVAGRL